jgi:hypothetical protein
VDLFVTSELYTKPVVTPPLSPSKRRRAESHYRSGDSSPSKKRDIVLATSVQNMSMEERGLLFGDSTNSKLEKNTTGEGARRSSRRT